MINPFPPLFYPHVAKWTTGDIELYIMSLGYILDEDIARMEIQGNCAYVRIQVPEEFYDNITTITDAQVLGVFVWVYEFNIIICCLYCVCKFQ